MGDLVRRDPGCDPVRVILCVIIWRWSGEGWSFVWSCGGDRVRGGPLCDHVGVILWGVVLCVIMWWWSCERWFCEGWPFCWKYVSFSLLYSPQLINYFHRSWFRIGFCLPFWRIYAIIVFKVLTGTVKTLAMVFLLWTGVTDFHRRFKYIKL